MRCGARLSTVCLLGAAMAIRSAAGGVTDLAGSDRDPFEGHAAAVVLVFVQPDCPISNRYAPELRRIARDYAPGGARLWAVYAGDVTPSAARSHHGRYLPELPALLDPDMELVAEAEVTVTPEVALFLPDRTLAYRGRIDDRYVSFGRQRAYATRRDLVAALDAVLGGSLPETRATEAIGCFLVTP